MDFSLLPTLLRIIQNQKYNIMRTNNYFLGITLSVGLVISCSQSSKHEAIASEAQVSEITAIEEESEQHATIQFTPPVISEDLSMEDISNQMMDMKEISQDKEVIQRKTSLPQNYIASGAASTINDDSIHKLIRSANIRFKVNDIPQATYSIEQIIIRHNGLIMESSIKNYNKHTNSIDISKDSTLLIHHYNLTSNLQLRVHNSKLDTILKEIAPLAVEIDYRTVTAKDVTFQLLAEKLKKERMAKKQKRISSAIDNRGRRLNDVMDAENTLDYALEQEDNAKLSAYKMNDDIEYSTINIQLYQNPTTYKEKIAKEKSIEEFEPSLGDQALNSLHNGWIIICTLFITILNIWPLLLIIAIAAYIIIKFKKKKNNP